MMVRIMGVVLALATAQGAASANEVRTSRRNVDPDRIICRNMPLPGSRLRAARACRTASEWAALLAEVRAGARLIQGEGSTFCIPSTRVPISTCR